jgi:hypothetical protein
MAATAFESRNHRFQSWLFDRIGGLLEREPFAFPLPTFRPFR